ncbi:xanthine dehydrogenase accessory protein XdhC [Agromyces sp. H3Y2-19a]|uniref:xanthine dehydrogenase accessory protein XdhC n=1 Tax=Agromyces chromiiresistens TaxID=3030835 RepID=UPI0023B9D1A8|nr:xanthine dehydrogenase accessory protein XdhC [Agromyces chromiiresistens]MDF0514424.1 xanthine dehydrogenase accessory protein XdhC [Agromyces chromiiresistens]
MDWLDALRRLRDARTPAVIVTLAIVRGHAPRNGGAKMVVAPDTVFGTVGGGNLEQTAIDRARDLLATGSAEPELLTLKLSDKATTEYGVQCCGGEVTLMLEPVRVVPSVAVFGMGHVGLELARILARQELELHLVDSRAEMLAPERLGVPGVSGVLADAVADVRVHHEPVPEAGLVGLPPGAHVLIMTHDHLEDLAITDSALRREGLGSIGLIGSKSKWVRFQAKLTELGHDDAALARVTTPIGIPEVAGKAPATIAVSVAARILQLIEEAQPAEVNETDAGADASRVADADTAEADVAVAADDPRVPGAGSAA